MFERTLNYIKEQEGKEPVFIVSKPQWYEKTIIALLVILISLILMFFYVGSNPARSSDTKLDTAIKEIEEFNSGNPVYITQHKKTQALIEKESEKNRLLICKLYNDLKLPFPVECVKILD